MSTHRPLTSYQQSKGTWGKPRWKVCVNHTAEPLFSST